jgi:large subunit ribosomal protein L21
MYAIIRAGGKQAKVSEGDVIDVERIKATDEVNFTPLLVVKDDGTVISERDDLGKITVVAEVLGERRGEKVEVFKYKNKSGYRRRQGHRQTYTTLQVKTIDLPDTKKKKASAKKASEKASDAAKASAKKASAKEASEKAADAAKDTKSESKKAENVAAAEEE